MFVQLVIAAMTTAPCFSVNVFPLYSTCAPASPATAGSATATPPPPDPLAATARPESFPDDPAPASFSNSASTRLGVHRLRLRERHAVLRALRAGETRLDRPEVELERVGELGIRRGIGSEESLLLGVGLDELDVVLGAAAEAKVLERFLIAREEAHRRAVLRRHVGDRRAVGERKRAQARSIKLDELADDLLLPKHLRRREHEVRRRGAGRQLAVQLEADDFGNEHRNRLAEHRGLRFDAAHTPTEHAEPVDHRRVRVGADERVGVGDLLSVFGSDEYGLAEVLEIHLVADAGAGRHDAEVLERVLSPPQEDVALFVAVELELGVDQERGLRAVLVHLDRVVDDEVDRLERIDALRIAAERRDGVAHRGEIDDGGNAGEVLQQHTRGSERDLLLGVSAARPIWRARGCRRA